MSELRPLRTLVRACAAAAIGVYDRRPAEQVARSFWQRDDNVEYLLRGPTSPVDMTTPGLVRAIMPDFLTTLTAQSVAAKIFQEGLRLSFDRAGSISVPTLL